MIHAIEVINHMEDHLVIPVTDPLTWTEALKSKFNSINDGGYIITNITGIAPGKAVVNIPSYASLDGGVYASSRKDVRNIVISLRFDIGHDIESVRHQTYYWFPLRQEITIYFYTDQRTIFIRGYVESNESQIFSKDEGTDISILCPNPMFIVTDDDFQKDFFRSTPLMGYRMDFDGEDEEGYENNTIFHYGPMQTSLVYGEMPATTPGQELEGTSSYTHYSTQVVYTEFTGNTFVPGTTYYEKKGDLQYLPTTDTVYKPNKTYYTQTINNINEEFGANVPLKPLFFSLVGEKPFIISTRFVDPAFNFNYNGDVETGVIITVTANSGSPTGVLNIYNVYAEQIFQLDLSKIRDITGTAYHAGDQIIINTIPGKKNIQLRRDGVYTNILNAMVRGSDWITFFKGGNYVRYLTDGGYDFLDFHLEYQELYVGV